MAHPKLTRRHLLFTALSTASVFGTIALGKRSHFFPHAPSESNANAQPSPIQSGAQPEVIRAVSVPPTSIPQRILGGTGIMVPIFGLGGAASPLSRYDQEPQAIEIIERALDLGIRYFDTAANYGPSEERLGKVLPPYRQDLFLASKTAKRDRDNAWRELETSLTRLQTDRLDLWQFHALTREWDLDTLLDRKQGAILAAEEAQEQGIIRHTGITGHYDPHLIAEGLRRYPFDTALIPVNAADIHNPVPFITQVLPIAQQNNVGIIAMKVPAYGRLLQPGVLTSMSQAMGYTLSQPGVHSCIIAADNLMQLEENVQAAVSFRPLDPTALVAMEQKTQPVWEENSFFRDWG